MTTPTGTADEPTAPRPAALCLHGFGGTPAGMQAMASAFVDAGFDVAVPCLPGHGTTVADLAATRWEDWAAAATAGLTGLRSAVRPVVVVGQSMGASLALWLAE